MAILCYSGLPGKGKTAMLTHISVKHYKKSNGIIQNSIRTIINATKTTTDIKKLSHRIIPWFKSLPVCYSYALHNPINNVFTNYPVLLDVKKNIYSNVVNLDDLNMKYKFPKHSLIGIDEAQRYYDSREFKKFPKNLGTFLQHHRHADIDNIIFVTQHPRRLDNKMRDLCEVFRKYKIFFKIPFIPFIFAYYVNYYEFEDYGKYNHLKPEFRTYDYDNHFEFISSHKSFDRYMSKYFHVVFDVLPDIIKSRFTSKELQLDEINSIGVEV